MTTAPLPAIGTIGLTRIHGQVGKLIELGEWANGQGFRDWEHAFLLGPDGLILEAEPGGARLGNVSEYADIYWCTAIASQFGPAKLEMIFNFAEASYGPEEGKPGVGYSFLDYAAMFAHRLRIPLPGLRGYIGGTGHMICSQLCDVAYSDEGCHLFAGVWPGYVTPLGLWNLDVAILKETAIRPSGLAPAAGPRAVSMTIRETGRA